MVANRHEGAMKSSNVCLGDVPKTEEKEMKKQSLERLEPRPLVNIEDVHPGMERTLHGA